MTSYIIYALLFIILLPLAVEILGKVFSWYGEWAEVLWGMLPSKKRDARLQEQEKVKRQLRDAADKLVELFREKEPPEPPEEEVAPKVGEYWVDRSGKVWGPLEENRDIFYNRPLDNPRALLCGDMTWRNNGRRILNRGMFDLRKKATEQEIAEHKAANESAKP